MPTLIAPALTDDAALPAASCPPVPSAGQWPSHAFTVAGVATGANPPVSEALGYGVSGVVPAGLTLPGIVTRNAARQDLLASVGGAGSYAVAKGLTLTAGVGLTVSVAAGLALMDGPVELQSPLSQAVPDNTAHVFLWLLRGNPGGQPTLTYATALALPASPGILLGSVTTAGGAVTGLDTSGVMTLIGGQPTRHTADLGPPTDAPAPDTSFRAITAAGTFTWTGAAYVGGAGYRTLITGAVHNVTLTPDTNYLIGWDFSGAGGGTFGSDLYDAGLRCSDPNLIITQAEGQKTAGKMFFTLHYPSIAGSTTDVVCPLVPKAGGDGWSGPPSPSGGLTGAWDAVSVIG